MAVISSNRANNGTANEKPFENGGSSSSSSSSKLRKDSSTDCSTQANGKKVQI